MGPTHSQQQAALQQSGETVSSAPNPPVDDTPPPFELLTDFDLLDRPRLTTISQPQIPKQHEPPPQIFVSTYGKSKSSRVSCATCSFRSSVRFGATVLWNKGRVRESRFMMHTVASWCTGVEYAVNDCVRVRGDRQRDSKDRYAVCMVEHQAGENNFPAPGSVFHGLLAPLHSLATDVLIKYGLLDVICAIICSYSEGNKYWWPLCKDSYGCGNPATPSGYCWACSGNPLELASPAVLHIGRSMRLITAPDWQLTQEAISLLERNFHNDISPLISDCVNHTNFTGMTGIGNCHTWVFKHKILGMIGSLVWRCVCVAAQDNLYGKKHTRMLEILFLATREDVTRADVASYAVDYLLNYARLEAFDLVAVAAVPQQGVQFWFKQGFVRFAENGRFNKNALPLNKEIPRRLVRTENDQKLFRRMYADPKQFMLDHMLVFADTSIFAVLL